MTSMPETDDTYDPYFEVKFAYTHFKNLYGKDYADALEYKVDGEAWTPDADL